MPISYRIFISYRRSDQAGFAGRLCDHIDADPELKGVVFMNVDGSEAGRDFEVVVLEHLSQCDVVFGDHR